MPRLSFPPDGIFNPALPFGNRTPGMEATSRGRVNGAGHISFQQNSFLAVRFGVRDRNCGKQRFGVRV